MRAKCCAVRTNSPTTLSLTRPVQQGPLLHHGPSCEAPRARPRDAGARLKLRRAMRQKMRRSRNATPSERAYRRLTRCGSPRSAAVDPRASSSYRRCLAGAARPVAAPRNVGNELISSSCSAERPGQQRSGPDSCPPRVEPCGSLWGYDSSRVQQPRAWPCRHVSGSGPASLGRLPASVQPTADATAPSLGSRPGRRHL